MDRIADKVKTYCLCEVCGDMISPNAPAVETAVGFVGEDGFYIHESIVIHIECADSHIMQRIIAKLEKD